MKKLVIVLATVFLIILTVVLIRRLFPWSGPWEAVDIGPEGQPAIVEGENGMLKVPDIHYADREGSDPDLTSLDVYYKRWQEPRAVIVMIHGGAWQFGDKDRDAVAGTKSAYFTDQGYVFVSINYRLSPAVTYPAHVEDVAAALNWIFLNIDQYGGDPNRVIIMGHSAGAQLAALVACDSKYLEAYDLQASWLRGVILLDGAGYDIPRSIQGYMEVPKKSYYAAFTEDPAVWADASPINHIEAGHALPPFLIIYVDTREASRKQSGLLAEKIEASGSQVILYPARNANHLSLNEDIGTEGDVVTSQIMEFVNTHSTQ